MTPLAVLLAERIRESGPITVADYMADCLLHPVHGYYTTREPFGAAGDFITAPEISQMFGEVFGLALAQAWLDRGSPAPFTLTEVGPGRGTLMADVLRATRGVPGFHAAARVVLIEASDRLRALQAKSMAQYPGVTWLDRVEDLPDAPLFLIANEFLDALPIRQFLRGSAGWRERLIGLGDEGLVFGLSEVLPEVPETPAFGNAPEGAMVEYGLPARLAVASVAATIARHGGLSYWIDYGDWRSRGDTLQALRAHSFDPPLAHPGEADLTAHVDFEALVPPGLTYAYDTQGAVLARMGIEARAARLAQNLVGAALENHLAAHRRLTHPEEMGSVFKVLALTSAGAPLPPGFAIDADDA